MERGREAIKAGCCGFPIPREGYYRRVRVHAIDPLKALSQTPGLRYSRLHGVTGYRYLHTEEDLRALSAQCAGADSAYVLFNNLFMGEDGLRFQLLLQP